MHLRSPLQHHRARTGRCPSRDEIWRWARPRPSHGPSTRKMDLLAITLASIPSRACLSPSPRGFQDTDCEVVPGPLHAQGGCGYGWEMVGHLPVGATSTVSLFMVSEAERGGACVGLCPHSPRIVLNPLPRVHVHPHGGATVTPLAGTRRSLAGATCGATRSEVAQCRGNGHPLVVYVRLG